MIKDHTYIINYKENERRKPSGMISSDAQWRGQIAASLFWSYGLSCPVFFHTVFSYFLSFPHQASLKAWLDFDSVSFPPQRKRYLLRKLFRISLSWLFYGTLWIPIGFSTNHCKNGLKTPEDYLKTPIWRLMKTYEDLWREFEDNLKT